MIIMCWYPIVGCFFVLSCCSFSKAEAQFDGISTLLLRPSTKNYVKMPGTSMYVFCSTMQEDNSISELKWTGPEGDIPEDPEQRVFMERRNSAVALMIQSITEDLKGVYNCTGRQGDDGLVTTGFYLDIMEDIAFEDAPLEQYGTVGEEGIIKCSVTSRPEARVQWMKESKRLRSNDRVTITTGQIKINPVTKEDDGSYTCRAMVVELGLLKDRTIHFKAYVPPGYTEEDEVKMACSPTETGGHTGNKGFSTNQDRTLIINKGWFNNDGESRCVTKDDGDEALYILNLQKIMKPNITRFDDVEVTEGEMAEFECEAWGEPLPEVSIQRISSNKEELQTDEERITLCVTDIGKVRNVLLLVYNVSREDGGLYECVAENLGGSLQKRGELYVMYSPTFRKYRTQVWSWLHHKVNLTCIVDANPEAIIHWSYRNNRIQENSENIRIYQEEASSNLEVTPVDTSNFGVYTCIAANSWGVSSNDIELKEAKLPGVVNTVILENVTATTITFFISAVADNGGPPVEAYVVHYKETDQEYQLWHVWTVKAADVPFVLDNLKPNTAYEFRFTAQNVYGLGAFGPSYTVVTPVSTVRVKRATKSVNTVPMKPAIKAANPDEAIVEQTDRPHSYELRWLEPGQFTDYYRVQVLEVDEELQVKNNRENQIYRVTLSGFMKMIIPFLKADSLYKIAVSAHNDLGFSEATTIYIRTADV